MLGNLLNWFKGADNSSQDAQVAEVQVVEPHIFQDVIDHTSNNMYFSLHAVDAGSLSIRIDDAAFESSAATKLAIKEMRLAKKFMNLQKKQVQEQLQNARLNYRQHVANRGPMFRGGGQVGSVIRAFSASNRAAERASHANSLRPYENYIQYVDMITSEIDRVIIQAEQKAMMK